LSATADRIERIPRPEEPVPAVSWPTVSLFALGLLLVGGSSAAYLAGVWPWPVSTLINWAALYMFFTVGHEASHRTLSTHDGVNLWLGRISMFLLIPHAGFGLWRYVHMQHHRFTNHDDESDPDFFASQGKGWTLPLRWATIDVHYTLFYLRRLGSRPRREKVEELATLALMVAVFAALIATGHGVELLVLWVLPSRLALFGLAWGFDWLPHHGLGPSRERNDHFPSTRNRVGLERLLTPLMLYQNYHLVHHLHPVIPFHRYIAVWRRNESEYLRREPVLSSPLGREVTPEEYRRLRELDR
jgi:ring-1,2-phenylacetyl-CoA epoxidase subunit PaaE